MQTLSIILCALSLAAQERPWTEPFDITTTDGKTYRGCRVREVTPDTAVIVIESGVVRLPIAKLDAGWQARFGYDPEQAKQWQQEQAAERKARIEENQQDRIATLTQQLAEKEAELIRLRAKADALQIQLDAQHQAAANAQAQAAAAAQRMEPVTVINHVPVPVPVQAPVQVPVPVATTQPAAVIVAPAKPAVRLDPVIARKPVAVRPLPRTAPVMPAAGAVIPGRRPAELFKK